MSERTIESHLACLFGGLIIGISCTALTMCSHQSSKEMRGEIKIAHAEASATSSAAVLSNTIEGDLIRHDQKTDNAVDRALAAVRAAPAGPSAISAPCEGGYVIQPVAGDPDALWRAFADGYNSVLEDRDETGAGVHSSEGEGKLPAGTDRP